LEYKTVLSFFVTRIVCLSQKVVIDRVSGLNHWK